MTLHKRVCVFWKRSSIDLEKTWFPFVDIAVDPQHESITTIISLVRPRVPHHPRLLRLGHTAASRLLNQVCVISLYFNLFSTLDFSIFGLPSCQSCRPVHSQRDHMKTPRAFFTPNAEVWKQGHVHTDKKRLVIGLILDSFMYEISMKWDHFPANGCQAVSKSSTIDGTSTVYKSLLHLNLSKKNSNYPVHIFNSQLPIPTFRGSNEPTTTIISTDSAPSRHT